MAGRDFSITHAQRGVPARPAVRAAARLSIGLDVGSITVKAVVADAASGDVVWRGYERH